MVFPERPHYTLEDPDLRAVVTEDPRGFLEGLPRGGVIIDEIQRVPSLLSYLQGWVDLHQNMGEFILTGSAQLELMEAISQSLAGRTALLKLLPLSLVEMEENGLEVLRSSRFRDTVLWRGFMPALYQRGLNPTKTYRYYFETYITRDVRSLAQIRDLAQFQRFVRLCAGRVGQLLNMSSLAADLGVSQPTVRSWLGVLEASFVAYLLPPYFENFGKRITKTPKLYFYEPGLAAYLLGIENPKQLERDPCRGGLFENLVVNECKKARYNAGLDDNLYFFRDHRGEEVDLVHARGRDLVPVEIKSAATFDISFLKGLERFRRLAGDRVTTPAVVYAGAALPGVKGTRVMNFCDAASLVRL
jgi:predicted AAA+ superfamily ATPase